MLGTGSIICFTAYFYLLGLAFKYVIKPNMTWFTIIKLIIQTKIANYYQLFYGFGGGKLSHTNWIRLNPNAETEIGEFQFSLSPSSYIFKYIPQTNFDSTHTN